MPNRSRLAYLQAMGVDVYVRRHTGFEDVVEDVADSSHALEQELPSQVLPQMAESESTDTAIQVAGAKTSSSAETTTQPVVVNKAEADAEIMAEVSVEAIPPKQALVDTEDEYAQMAGAPREFDAPDEVEASLEAQSNDVLRLNWPQLAERVSQCQSCGLAANRTQTVFGFGNPQADVLVIGEAPGQEEDQQGEPFVGRAGQLLDAMLVAIGLSRQQVYISNILKCRPPNDRDPESAEIRACNAYLQRQIQLLQAKVILVVGPVAAQALLSTERPTDQLIDDLRGSVHTLSETQIPMIVTYHPAYLLEQPSQKAKSWQDLQRLMRLLAES